MYKIPLPLPKFELDNPPDDTGLTMTEKRALRNAWAIIISSDLEKHVLEQSLRFLTENEEMLDKFRNKHGHKFMVFDTLETLIFDGLEGFSQMNGLIKPIAVGHLQKNIEQADIRKMCSHLSEYLQEVLQKFMSPTLRKAINKICDIILMAHQKEKCDTAVYLVKEK